MSKQPKEQEQKQPSKVYTWKVDFTCGYERVRAGDKATAKQIKHLENLNLDLSKYTK